MHSSLSTTAKHTFNSLVDRWWHKVPIMRWRTQASLSFPTKTWFSCSDVSRLVHDGHGRRHHLVSPTVQYGLNAECELWRDMIETWEWLFAHMYIDIDTLTRGEMTYWLLLSKNVSIKGLPTLLLLLITLFPNLSFGLHRSLRQLRILLPLWHK